MGRTLGSVRYGRFGNLRYVLLLLIFGLLEQGVDLGFGHILAERALEIAEAITPQDPVLNPQRARADTVLAQ